MSYQPQGGIPTSIVDLKVTPGDLITIQGTLVGTDGKGIDGKTVKLAGKAIENLPDEKKTAVPGEMVNLHLLFLVMS